MGRACGLLRAGDRRGGICRADVPRRLVRAGDGHDMEVHIDTDEANAIAMAGSTMMEILP